MGVSTRSKRLVNDISQVTLAKVSEEWLPLRIRHYGSLAEAQPGRNRDTTSQHRKY